MSVRTTADEKLDSAKEHLQQSINDLHDVLKPDTWGSSDFKDEAIDKFEAALSLLRKAWRLL